MSASSASTDTAVQVVAGAIAAVEAAAGIAGRHEHHAALGVDGHEAPVVNLIRYLKRGSGSIY